MKTLIKKELIDLNALTAFLEKYDINFDRSCSGLKRVTIPKDLQVDQEDSEIYAAILKIKPEVSYRNLSLSGLEKSVLTHK